MGKSSCHFDATGPQKVRGTRIVFAFSSQSANITVAEGSIHWYKDAADARHLQEAVTRALAITP
jgi:hypothetical protein